MLLLADVQSSQNEIYQAVLTYKEIKAKIAFLEAELKASKEVLEAACSKTEEGVIITDKFKVTLSIAERENFSLKNAKAELGDVLKPFISKTAYTVLKVN